MIVENRSGARIPVLHLMNGIDDCSITSMVLQQIKYFGDSRYEWHVAGLSGVAVRDEFCVSKQMRKYQEVYDGLLGGASLQSPAFVQASSGS